MSKREQDDFIRLCNNLEENYSKEYNKENKITYVRKFLYSASYIKNKDMLLKIKAEAEENDYNITLSLIFSMLAMFFSSISVFLGLIHGNIGFNWLFNIICLVAIIIIMIFTLKTFNRCNSLKKWRKYVLVVVNQMIEKIDKKKKHKK